MRTPASDLERFVRTLHRRLVVVRAAEAAGLGALAGCGAAVLLIPLLVWRGQPPMLPAAAMVLLGAAGGLMWSLSRRPSRLDAAMEADRQLDLADLLGTAISAGGGRTSNDPWQRTVVALAEARCRRHKPSEVLLNRFGARAWGGIGLAAALVFTLAALPGFPSGAGASDGGGQGARRVGERVRDGGFPAFAGGNAAPAARDAGVSRTWWRRNGVSGVG